VVVPLVAGKVPSVSGVSGVLGVTGANTVTRIVLVNELVSSSAVRIVWYSPSVTLGSTWKSTWYEYSEGTPWLVLKRRVTTGAKFLLLEVI